MSRDWRLYLGDILQCCGKVERYTAGMTQAQFLGDERTFDAVIRNLEVIGEAAKNIPEEARQNLPQIEWRKIAGMRDWLAHAYFGIDADIVWDVVANKISLLKSAIENFQESQ